MADFDNTNRGAIFANDKQGNDKRPDRRGSLNVEGVDFWVSGWLKKDKSGNPFLSISVERKDAQQGQSSSRPASQPQQRPAQGQQYVEDDADDQIPF